MFTLEAFIFGFTQGFVLGPLTLFAIREGLNPRKGVWFELEVFLGAFVTNIFYLMLATYGVTRFIEYDWVRLFMWSAAAYMLIRMGINSLLEHDSRMSFKHAHRHQLRSPFRFLENDFFKGFLLSLFNPMAIVFSLLVVGSLYATYSGPSGPAGFAMSVNLGGFLSSLAVCVLTLFVREIFRPWMLKKILILGSFILIVYGAYFSYKALLEAVPLVQAFIL